MALTDRESCIVLNLLPGIGASKFLQLCNLFKKPAEIFTQSEACLTAIPAIGQQLAHKIVNWQKFVNLKRELSLAEQGGVEIITCIDSNYPPQLKEINDFPLCLYVRGTLPDFNQPTLAVVGSRRMTSYGRKMTETITSAAAYAGWTIVSGLAYGIDKEAHQTCLNAEGTTVAVMGGGLTRIHPQDHIPLARKIIETGAVITEFPMEYSPNKTSFPMRNRIISALSQAVLVIEAGFKSGSLITANFALEQGKSIFAVPGRVENPQSRGCHSLIKQGAKLTESFEDILEDFEFLPGFSNMFNSPPPALQNNNLDLSKNEKEILKSLENEEKNIDALADELQLEISELLPLLMRMEIKKLISQSPGKIFSINN